MNETEGLFSKPLFSTCIVMVCVACLILSLQTVAALCLLKYSGVQATEIKTFFSLSYRLRKDMTFPVTTAGPADQWKGEFYWFAVSFSGHGPLDQWKGEFYWSDVSFSGHGPPDQW